VGQERVSDKPCLERRNLGHTSNAELEPGGADQQILLRKRMEKPRTIRDLFLLPGFVPVSSLNGVFGDRYARIVRLKRQKKAESVRCVLVGARGGTTGEPAVREIFLSLAGGCTSSLSVGECPARGAALCL
jgi:hypothetical protein